MELPTIITEAKNKDTKILGMYTEKDYELVNCTLSEDGKTIVIDTNNVKEASIKIKEGTSNSTTLNITVTTNASNNNQNNIIDSTVVPDEKLPQTGIDITIIISIIVISVIAVTIYIKGRNYKDIK